MRHVDRAIVTTHLRKVRQCTTMVWIHVVKKKYNLKLITNILSVIFLYPFFLTYDKIKKMNALSTWKQSLFLAYLFWTSLKWRWDEVLSFLICSWAILSLYTIFWTVTPKGTVNQELKWIKMRSIEILRILYVIG